MCGGGAEGQRLGSAEWTVGLNDLKYLFQLDDSMIKK